MFTVDILASGDTFSGTSSFDSCFDVADHPTALVVAKSQGNGFRGSIISRIGNSLRSSDVRGFFHVASRQLIVVPADVNSNSLSLVCSYDAESDNDADCKILTDFMTRQCGTVGLSRDRTSKSSTGFTVILLPSLSGTSYEKPLKILSHSHWS